MHQHLQHLIPAALLCSLLLPAAAPAADDAPDCANAMTQTDMNLCADQEARRADAELNRLYKQVMGQLDGEGQTRLREVQRSWLKYRDLNCAYETLGYVGGSMEPLVHASCIAQLTQERNEALKRLMPEGNPD